MLTFCPIVKLAEVRKLGPTPSGCVDANVSNSAPAWKIELSPIFNV